MIKRYADSGLSKIWSDEFKVECWQRVELAVISARAQMGTVSNDVCRKISEALNAVPVDIKHWLELEKELKHDLNAFVTERKEKLPVELRRYFHDGMTSYDTEEPAMALILNSSCLYVLDVVKILKKELIRLAKRYCFTPMNARTHGQEAEMQSFGARCLTWLVAIELAQDRLIESLENLNFSKLSGAIGKYGSISPDLEARALHELGLKPFFGATQIVPREVYLPTAQALCQLTQAVNKIAYDIRLSARSGKPLMQEPFGKKQTGSSAMPHKKNPISLEKVEGMERLARAYLQAIEEGMQTWEERSIEQSSCERVAWPDLFHVTVHAVSTLARVLNGLRVYPDNMLWEIINSRGCYAAAQAKDWLKKHGEAVGIDEESAYRIVQLAAFNVHEANTSAVGLRDCPSSSYQLADGTIAAHGLYLNEDKDTVQGISIEDVIPNGLMHHSSQLDHEEAKVSVWNEQLRKLFEDKKLYDSWIEIFRPSYLLRNEVILFQKILGWTPGEQN